MKILKYITFSIALIFFSCEDTEKDFEFPAPSILAEIPDIIVQEPGNTIIQEFTLQSASGLQTLNVFQDGELIESVDVSNANTTIYTFEYTIPEDTEAGTASEFSFVLTDAEGRQATDQLSLLVDITFIETIENINGTEVTQVKGKLNEDYTMEAAKIYLVDNIFSIENNSTLTIEAGTQVYFKTFDDQGEVSRLVITQGSKIMAEGTADNPIVFTSDKLLTGDTPEINDWGGVFIYGNAPTNAGAPDTGITSDSDTGFRYGGNVPNDNSGVLRYIRSEYAGKNNTSNLNDAHAFKFFGLGSETQIDHIQVFRNRNVAFRIKGGRISVKYLSAIGHGGYGLWGSEGWQGEAQFLVFQTDVRTVQGSFWGGARAIEMRNDGTTALKEPRTTFTISNVTSIGNGMTPIDSDDNRRGIRVQDGAIGRFFNAIFTEFPDDAINIQDLDVNEFGVNMRLENIRLFNNQQNYVNDAETFAANDSYNITEDLVTGISLTSFVGSETTTGNPDPAEDFDPSSLGSFFTSAPYIGAVESAANDWTTEGDSWFKNLDGSFR